MAQIKDRNNPEYQKYFNELNKMVNINITKIIDKLIANISFILTFFFKYLTIGSKRIAINIDIIIVIK